MEHHIGTCMGGPLDGQRLEHWSKTKDYFRGLPEQADYIRMGTYHLNDFGQWHWHQSAEGKAANVLFGAKSDN